MKYRLLIRPDAESDLAQAKNWLNKQQPGLGKKFLLNVKAVIREIQSGPEHYAVEYKDVRVALVARYSYVIYFRVVDELIQVIAVLHGHRAPETWKSRAT